MKTKSWDDDIWRGGKKTEIEGCHVEGKFSETKNMKIKDETMVI